jgi:pimeloyl-ACP methyl ester carboxylesterase
VGESDLRRAEWEGWELLDVGVAEPTSTVLLLPGAQCTAAFYADVLHDPRPPADGVRLVAATPPGFGGRPARADLGVAAYVGLTAMLADHVGADVVVGHSYFANVAIELAAAGRTAGPLVLLSPALSRGDEELGVRVLGLASRLPVVGAFPWLVAGRALGPLMEGRLPRHDHARLVAEMRRSDWRVNRQLAKDYAAYLAEAEHETSIADRLVASGVPAWVVRGDHDEIGLTDAERAALDAGPSIRTVDVPDAGHFVLTDQPAAVVDVILDALASRGRGQRSVPGERSAGSTSPASS